MSRVTKKILPGAQLPAVRLYFNMMEFLIGMNVKHARKNIAFLAELSVTRGLRVKRIKTLANKMVHL